MVFPNKKRFVLLLLSLFFILIGVALFSLSVGGAKINLHQAWFDSASADHDILFYARLPRVLLAILVGFALSSGGVAFQSLLRNPLADPYILGVSGGAALGSVVAVALGLPFTWVSLIAFGASVLSLMLIYWVAQAKGRLQSSTLLLTGVIFNAFTFALIMFFNSLVSFEQAHRIWYLMVGSLGSETYGKLAIVSLLVGIGFLILLFNSQGMNLMAAGEESAQYLGLDLNRFRKRIFVAGSLMVGATVSLAGLIGFLGLFVPHMMRMILGSDHRYLLPSSALFGASFLVLADWIARSALSGMDYQTQLPVGVLTALIGGPFFVYLLKRRSTS